MGTSRSGHQLAGKIAKAAASLSEAERAGVRAAALTATRIIRGEIRSVVSSGRLSGVGRRGARVGARFDVWKSAKDPSALVRATGPLHLVENDTAPHKITPRRRRGRRRALRLADGGFARSVNHPGTKGRSPFARGAANAAAPAAAAFRQEISKMIGRVFR